MMCVCVCVVSERNNGGHFFLDFTLPTVFLASLAVVDSDDDTVLPTYSTINASQ